MDEVDSLVEELFWADRQDQEGAGLDLSVLNLSSLAHLCRQATDRFFQHGAYDDRYCLELFRRAIWEQDEEAWQILVDQYGNLVTSWVQRHHAFALADEDREYFVNRTFANFWRAFSRDPQKLAKFGDLKSLLQYLKLCAYSAVQEYVERQMRPRHMTLSDKPIETIADLNDYIGDVDDHMLATTLWKHVLSSVKNDQERIVARDYLLYDMKPREIYARHKDVFASVSQLRRVKGNLMARLRRDNELLSFLADFE